MIQRNLPITLALLLCLLVGSGCASSGGQKRFKSTQAAAAALVQALRAHDTAQLKQIFGPDSGEIVSSGDAVADRNQADRFLAAYDQQHRFETEANGDVTLVIGDQDWPFPV